MEIREKSIKIFIASSIDEFRHERNELQNFIEELARTMRGANLKNGVYIDIEAVRCEDVDPAYNKGRKQDEFNELLMQCDIIVFLFCKKAGAYTLEELRVASEALNNPQGKMQQAFVFLFEPKDGEADESIKALMNKLNEESCFYRNVKHIDEVKSALLCAVTDLYKDYAKAEIIDGAYYINGKKLLDLS